MEPKEFLAWVFSRKDGLPNKTVLAGEVNPLELLMVTQTDSGVEEPPLTLPETETVGGRLIFKLPTLSMLLSSTTDWTAVRTVYTVQQFMLINTNADLCITARVATSTQSVAVELKAGSSRSHNPKTT